MLLSEAMALYLMRPNLAASTKVLYERQVRYLIGMCGDKAIEDVQLADLMRYIALKQNSGGSARSLNMYTNFFKSFFGWLWRYGYLDVSPAAKMEGVSVQAIPDNERAISKQDWGALKAYCQGRSPRDYALLCFMLDSACRVSAVADLKMRDLNMDDCSAVVYEAKIRSRVEVSFGDETGEALEAWLKARPNIGHDYVFTTVLSPYGPLKAQSIREMMKRACVAVGLPAWTPHSLRHATLQHFAHQENVTLLDVQSKANHLSPKTTLENYFPQKSRRVGELTRRYSLVGDASSPKAVMPQLRIVPKSS